MLKKERTFTIKTGIRSTTAWKILRLLAQKNIALSTLSRNGRVNLLAVLGAKLQKNGICRTACVLRATKELTLPKNKLLGIFFLSDEVNKVFAGNHLCDTHQRQHRSYKAKHG
jgi:hypothetical protein